MSELAIRPNDIQANSIPNPQSSRRVGLEDKCKDMGVDTSEFGAENIRFAERNKASVMDKVKHGAGVVAKGTAAVAGIGVLGVMAGATAIAVKSKNAKDDFCAGLGEAFSYKLAMFLAGNSNQMYSRLYQSGMDGVAAATTKKAANRQLPRAWVQSMAPDNGMEL